MNQQHNILGRREVNETLNEEQIETAKKQAHKAAHLLPYSWKAGQSGNPNGRPKGAKSRSTTYKKWLEVSTESHNPVTNETEVLPVEDQIVLAQIVEAKKGNVAAAKEIFDSVYGKVLDRKEITTKTELDSHARMLLVSKIQRPGVDLRLLVALTADQYQLDQNELVQRLLVCAEKEHPELLPDLEDLD